MRTERSDFAAERKGLIYFVKVWTAPTIMSLFKVFTNNEIVSDQVP